MKLEEVEKEETRMQMPDSSDRSEEPEPFEVDDELMKTLELELDHLDSRSQTESSDSLEPEPAEVDLQKSESIPDQLNVHAAENSAEKEEATETGDTTLIHQTLEKKSGDGSEKKQAESENSKDSGKTSSLADNSELTEESKESLSDQKPDRSENTENEKETQNLKKSVLKDANPLRIGIASLQELEEMMKSYRIMNHSCLKRRYIMSRENVEDEEGKVFLEKGDDITSIHLKKMRRKERGHVISKIFLPDEGIVTVSDQITQEGKHLEQMIYHHLMRLGNKAYEAFVDRIGSIHDFLNLFTSSLFPKLILIGVVQTDLLEMERINVKRIQRLDPYLRFIEITHYQLKPFAVFQDVKNIHISQETEEEWDRILNEIIIEYTKPYFVED
ncbi:MAG: hypothetical protein OEZ34_05425 [Spirochaetia bacterium]|nr:hypothetical protein [Spirochaetia bacterium]